MLLHIGFNQSQFEIFISLINYFIVSFKHISMTTLPKMVDLHYLQSELPDLDLMTKWIQKVLSLRNNTFKQMAKLILMVLKLIYLH